MGDEGQPKMSSTPAQDSAPPILDYATPASGGLVEIARYSSMAEASLSAAVLEQQSIRSHLLNANTNSLNYGGIAQIELHVGARDADRAVEVLKRALLEELEPAEEPPDAPPIRDEQGRELAVAPVAAFESVRLMRDAQTILLSQHIKSYVPELVVRGDRPARSGKRFVLRVHEEDRRRAAQLLAEAAAEDDEPRCPRCQSWQVRPISLRFLVRLATLFQLIARPPDLMKCQVCGRRGLRKEYARSRPSSDGKDQ